jgi:ketosteroid isomerase-like protein
MLRRTFQVVGFLGILATPVRAQMGAGAVVDAIKVMENKWATALDQRDTAAVGKMLAADYVFINQTGSIQNRQQYLTGMMDTTFSSTGGKNSDQQVRTYSDVAVDLGTSEAMVRRNGGTATVEHYRWTDVWAKQADGSWKCVSSQVATMKTGM